jgi:hypothetical protein
MPAELAGGVCAEDGEALFEDEVLDLLEVLVAAGVLDVLEAGVAAGVAAGAVAVLAAGVEEAAGVELAGADAVAVEAAPPVSLFFDRLFFLVAEVSVEVAA